MNDQPMPNQIPSANPIIPNADQIGGFVRILMPLISGLLISHGASQGIADALTGPTAASFWIGLVSLAIPTIWMWVTHTVSGKLAAVEALPSVEKIEIKPNASNTVMAIANDNTRPKVVAAAA